MINSNTYNYLQLYNDKSKCFLFLACVIIAHFLVANHALLACFSVVDILVNAREAEKTYAKGNMATARFARLFTLTPPSSATPVASASFLRSLAAVENGPQKRWSSGGKCAEVSYM